MPAFITQLVDWIRKIPRLFRVIIVGVLLAAVLYCFYKAGQASVVDSVSAVGATKDNVVQPALLGPPVIFLICALVASFLLAGLISINQATALGRSQVLLIGSVISVISIAVIYASWQVFEKEPSKGHFLLAADFIGLCLLVLALCYIPKLVQELQGIQSIFLRITALLCFAGAAGGLAFHLVNHEGHLVIPALGVITEERTYEVAPASTPSPDSTAPGTKVTVQKTSRAEKISRPAFHIGFIGDLILGLITANALHLALASLIKYDTAGAEDRRTQYFTLLALGILSGYAGNTALSAWTGSIVKKDEVKAEVQAAVAETMKTDAETPAVDLSQGAEIAKAVTGCLTRLEWPDEAKVAQMAKFRAALKESKKTYEKLSVDELIAAASGYLFSPVPDLVEAKKCLASLGKAQGVSPLQAWTAGMLRVLLATREGASSAASKTAWYDEVRADLQQIRVTVVSKDQHAARSIVAKFSLFAAVLDNAGGKGPEQPLAPSLAPDWAELEKGLGWTEARPSQQMKNATRLAQSVAAFLQNKRIPSLALSEDWVPLIHFATAMRAVPKELFVIMLPAADEKTSSALAPFAQTAPSFTAAAQDQTEPPSPTQTERRSQRNSAPVSPTIVPQPNASPLSTPVRPSPTPESPPSADSYF